MASTCNLNMPSYYDDGHKIKQTKSTTMENQPMNFGTPGVYEIRTGAAAPIKYPTSINVAGALTSPFNYYAGRKSILDSIVQQCRLEIKTSDRKITMFVDDKNPNGQDVIVGQLIASPYLNEWCINSAERWAVREFILFLRQNKFWFTSPTTCEQLIKQLMTWNGKVERLIQDIQKDNRGNTVQMLETRVSEFDLMERFQLSIPIFGGYGKETFSVEIGFEPKSTAVDLFLVSDELHMLTMTKTEQYLNDELQRFESAGFKCSTIWIN